MENYNRQYFLERWVDSVKRSPDSRMLIDSDGQRQYTRKEVDEMSGRVYRYLKEHQVGTNDFVMIYMPRTVDIFVAALGVLKAGAYFTIMEDHYPRERVEMIMHAANCKMELNAAAFAEATTLETEADYVKSDLHTPAFAVFTSGSTGNPKGIIHEYGNIGHIMDSVVYPDCEGIKEFALIAPTNFVATILLFMVALKDETIDVQLLQYDIVKNPKRLAEYIVTKGVTHIFVSPSMMRAANNLIGLPLKLIITGSEAATDVYNPDTPVMNFYCMSETGFCVSQFLIDKPYKNCPVGKSETGVHEIFLIREDGTKIEGKDEIGEICVENPYVRGYVGLPEETKRAFVNGVFHTNDLGRFDENGNLVYMGRANDMIKINGNRIEPAEIEAAFKEILHVNWCAAKGFVTSSSYICLYYKDDITFDEDEVRRRMEEKLPYYMIPSYFMKIDDIPLTQTGKFDRKALPQPSAELQLEEYVAPANAAEEKLCNVFAGVLGIERVGINDDFYRLGGDSLKSVQVIAEIDSDFLTAEDLFKGRTAKKTAEIWTENEKAAAGTAWEEGEAEARKGSYPLFGVEKKYVEEIISEGGKLGANISRLISFPLALNAEKICAAMNQMLHHRPVWGTYYYYDEQNHLMQRYDEALIPTVRVEKMTEAEFDSIKRSLLPAFAPTDNIMGVARVIETESRIYALIGMSHAKIDGYSARMFWNDMLLAYRGAELSRDSYYSCLLAAERNEAEGKTATARAYFDGKYGKVDWLRCLPGDKDDADHERVFALKPLPFTITEVEQAEKRLETSRNAIFAAVTLIAVAKMAQNFRPMLNWTYQDRSGRMKENACGLLMKRLPIAMDLAKMQNLKEGLQNIREQILEGMAHSEAEWICENETGLTDDVLSFVYQPADMMDTSTFEAIGAHIVDGVLPNPGTARRCAVMVVEKGSKLISTVNYMKGLYSEEYIERFSEIFSAVAAKVITDEKGLSLGADDFIG